MENAHDQNFILAWPIQYAMRTVRKNADAITIFGPGLAGRWTLTQQHEDAIETLHMRANRCHAPVFDTLILNGIQIMPSRDAQPHPIHQEGEP